MQQKFSEALIFSSLCPGAQSGVLSRALPRSVLAKKLLWPPGAFLWRRRRFFILAWIFYLKLKPEAAGAKTNLKTLLLWLNKLSAQRNTSRTGCHGNPGMTAWPQLSWPITGIIFRCKKKKEKILRLGSGWCFLAANEASNISGSEEQNQRVRERERENWVTSDTVVPTLTYMENLPRDSLK